MKCECERCNKKLEEKNLYSIKITSGGSFAFKKDDAVEFKLCKSCFKGFATFTDHWCTKKEE